MWYKFTADFMCCECMRSFVLFFQIVCFAFAIFLTYQVVMALYSQNYQLMDIVADVGTILICIDLGVFLWHSTAKKPQNMQELAHQLDQPVSKFVKFTRKLGHLGIMLILCSWIVPML